MARVGDLGDEQPLATRDEASDMTSGALVKWDGVNEKMIAPASNVGDDTHPLKIVNGIPVQIANALTSDSYTTGTVTKASGISGTITYTKFGRIVILSLNGIMSTTAGNNITITNDAPKAAQTVNSIGTDTSRSGPCIMSTATGSKTITMDIRTANTFHFGTLVYVTEE